MKTEERINLRPYYTFGLPLLALMGLIGLGGVALAVMVYFFF
ncbi:MAG TPA: hypothetical protein VLJ15_08050 [Gammaproteobacteria bacterium]|nr:hypothetical protein [Gammaproteobacteria bacterium]